MQYKFLSKTEIEELKKRGIKVTVWNNRTIHSITQGDLYFCDIHTSLPIKDIITKNSIDTSVNDSFDLN